MMRTKQQFSSCSDGSHSLAWVVLLGSLMGTVSGCEKHAHLHNENQQVLDQQQSSSPPLLQIPIYRKLHKNMHDDEDDHGHRQLPGSLLSGINHLPLKNKKPVFEGFGTQFMDLYIGQPPQKRTLAVQTSSEYTAIACDACVDDKGYNHCGKDRDDLYDTKQSQTFAHVRVNDQNTQMVCPNHVVQNYEFTNTQFGQNGQCTVEHQFLDISSYKGYHAVDQTYVGGMGMEHAFPMKFICQTRTSGKYTDQVVDGIVSLSPSPYSLISQLKQSGQIHQGKFSACFNAKSSLQSDQGEETGIITLGGYDPLILNTPMLYTPFVPSVRPVIPGYRTLLKRIHIRSNGGQTAVTLPQQNVVTMELPRGVIGSTTIDSDHPYLTFQYEFRETFHRLWNQAMEGSGITLDTIPHDISQEDIQRLPTLLLEFGEGKQFNSELDPQSVPALASNHNLLVAIPATHYMEYNKNNGKKRHRIQFHSQASAGDHGYSIVGANAMQGHTIVFDLENHKIGFGEVTQCKVGASSIRQSGDAVPAAVATPIDIQSAAATVIEQPQEHQEQPEAVGINPNIILTENSGGTVVTPQKAYANVVDDDMFAPLDTTPSGSKSQQQNQKERSSEGIAYSTPQGSCVTATCRSFLGLGYVIVGTVLAVAYRVSRPKERTMPSELLQAAINAANGYGLPGTTAYSMQNKVGLGSNAAGDGGDVGSVSRSVKSGGGGSVGSMSRRSNAVQDDATLGGSLV